MSSVKKLTKEQKRKNLGLINQNLLSLSYGNVIKKNIKENSGLLPQSFETYQIIKPGELVFRFTDLQNDKRSLRSGLSTEEGIITSAYVVVTPDNEQLSSKYFAYLMRAYDLAKIFYGLGSGLREGLSYSGLSKLQVPLPPINEQEKISEYLDEQKTMHEEKQQAILDTIALLKEKRQALISEAVSGKLDVTTYESANS